MLDSMFTPGLPLIEKVLRPLIVYVALVLLLRIFGKRELAQMNPFDIVVLLSLANTVQNAIIGNDNSVSGGLIGALALMAGNYLVVRFLFRHRRLDEILAGKPSVLIDKGHVRHKALAEELITGSDLAALAHRQGITDLKEVERCVLEPGGSVQFVRKELSVEAQRHAELMALLQQVLARLGEERK